MTVTARGGGGVEAPTSVVPYRLVVPAAWARLPMDPLGMRDAARAMLRRRNANLPRDQTAALRHEVEQQLVAITRRPGGEYARMLLLLSLEVHRRPVTASCLVSLLPRAVADEEALQAVAAELATGAIASVVEDLGDHRGVVVVRDEVHALPDAPAGVDVQALGRQYADAIGLGDTQPEPGAPGSEPWTPGTTRHLEVYLPVLDSPRLLLLSFSTPIVPLFGSLTELFLMMAGTVQWEREPGRWS